MRTTVTLHSPEWDATITVPFRNDANQGSWFLVKRVKEDRYRWATPADLGSEKECAIPALYVDELWRGAIGNEDLKRKIILSKLIINRSLIGPTCGVIEGLRVRLQRFLI